MYYNNATKLKLFCEVLKFMRGILYISSQKHIIATKDNEKERLEREAQYSLFHQP